MAIPTPTILVLARLLAHDPEPPEPFPGDGPGDRVRLHFELGGLGYQGNVTRLRYDEPGDARTEVERHGVELLGGGTNVGTDGEVFSWFHSEIGRGGVHFGATLPPERNNAALADDKPEPRHGFNFGIFAHGRENAGFALGGRCGFAMSAIGRGSIKAYTRSTVPGNHILVGLGAAGGLHCHEGPTFALVQWSIDGNLGAEQVQNLRFQHGNDLYSPSRDTSLLFFPTHGPVVTLVHDSDLLHVALTGRGFWSFGKGSYGGRRFGVHSELALAMGEKTALGLAPWYQFDRIDYGEPTKVSDQNTRYGHTFGVSFVYAQAHR